MLKVLVLDRIFLICAALDFALIWGSHYMMERHGWCAEGISLCGRYVTGTLTIMSASTAWYFTHPRATASEMITIVWLFLFIAGASTVLFYLIDGWCDKNAAEADLAMAKLAVKKG
jgi:hypothetical protein